MNLTSPLLQAAIIDLDGTMVDTLGDFEVALNRALADLDLPFATRALVEHIVVKGSEHLIRTVLAHQLALTVTQCQEPLCQGRSVDNL
jgi:phosphoglycolate phosphatase